MLDADEEKAVSIVSSPAANSGEVGVVLSSGTESRKLPIRMQLL